MRLVLCTLFILFLVSCGDSGGSSGSSNDTKLAPSFATIPNMTIDDNDGGLATEIDLMQYASNVDATSVYEFVSMPPAKMKLLLAWVELHKDELVADWELAASGQKPYKIEPLR